MVGAALLVAAAGLGALAYSNRVTLALHLYPPALLSMATSGQQLQKGWNESAPDDRVGLSTSLWTLTQMAALCDDQERYEKFSNVEEFSRLRRFDIPNAQDEANLYGGDGTMSAATFVERLKNRKQDFCADEYFVANHDGRVTVAAYARREANRQEEKAGKAFYIANVVRGFVAKTQRKGGELAHHELTEDEILYRECAKVSGFYNGSRGDAETEATFGCFWRMKELKQGIVKSDAQQASDFLDRAFPVNTASSDSDSNQGYSESRHSPPPVDIRDSCRKVHGTNYTYRDICENKQEEARRDIKRMSVPDEVARYCDAVHTDSYVYRKICYEKQIAAKERRSY